MLYEFPPVGTIVGLFQNSAVPSIHLILVHAPLFPVPTCTITTPVDPFYTSPVDEYSHMYPARIFTVFRSASLQYNELAELPPRSLNQMRCAQVCTKQITAGCMPYFCPSSSPRNPFHLLPPCVQHRRRRRRARRQSVLATLMSGMAMRKTGLAKRKYAAQESVLVVKQLWDHAKGALMAHNESPLRPSWPQTRDGQHQHAVLLPSQTSAPQTNSSHIVGGRGHGMAYRRAGLV